MKVLVTGGAGYIGSHVCSTLLASGHEVLIIDNFTNSSTNVISNIQDLANSQILYQNCNILDEVQINLAFQKFQPDLVVHLAGLKSVVESISQPLEYFKVNFSGTINILQAMDYYGCNKIIFSSSATVYGPSDKSCTEDSPVAPTNPYGHSKLMTEKLLQHWCSSSKNKSAIVFRYFNPLGADPSGLIGENSTSEPSNIMPILLKSIDKSTEFKIFGNDYDTIDGTGVRDYVHVSDVADAHVKAIGAALPSFEVLNLGIGKGTSVFELVKALEQACEKNIRTTVVKRRQGDIAYSCADPGKANKLLNWHPRYNIFEMCLHSWKFFRYLK